MTGYGINQRDLMKLLLSFLLILATPTALIDPKIPNDSSLNVQNITPDDKEKTSQKALIDFDDLSTYQQQVRKHPHSPEAYYDQGLACLNNPRWPDLINARKAFKRAIALKPDYAEAYNSLGMSYQGFKFGLVIYGTFYKKAVEAHKKAIRLKPDYAEAYWGLGKAYLALGQHDRAMEALQQAIHLKPDYEEAKQQIREVQQDIERVKNLKNLYTTGSNKCVNRSRRSEFE
jgi:tetratricopeptide (TPR) repeat protein